MSVSIVALVVLVAGTLAAAIVDVRTGRIPNKLTAAMAIAAVVLRLGNGGAALPAVLVTIGIAFGLGALAFSAGWFGGGDVKLIAAACGLVSFPGCESLVAFVLVAGAVLALVQAACSRRLVGLVRNTAQLVRTGSMPDAPTRMPYGIAIAGGSIAYAWSVLIPAMKVAQ